MGGPWEDFNSGDAGGPWQDFSSAPAPTTPQAQGPWSDFAAPQAQAPQAAPRSNPGPLDYLGEVGKAFGHGAVEAAVASPLRGLGAQNPLDMTFQAALEMAQRGEDFTQVQQQPNLPVTQEPAYQLGERVSKGYGTIFPDRNILNPVVRDVASGFGSVGGNIATSVVPGVRAAAIPSLIFQGAGEAAERAVKAGATEEQIRRAANFGNIAGASEFADLLLLHTGSAGAAMGLMKKVGVAALKGAMIEGGQEGLQQFIQNVIARGIYKPNQELMEEVPYNAMIGAIVGGTIGGATTRHDAPQTPPTPEMLQTSAAPLSPAPVPSGVQPSLDDLMAQIDPLLQPPQEPAAPTPPVAPQPAGTGVQAQSPVPPKTTPLPWDVYGDVTVNGKPVMSPEEAPLTTQEVEAKSIPPDVVEYSQKNLVPQLKPQEPLTLPEPRTLTQDDLFAPMREEVQTTPGADLTRLADMLSTTLYGDLDSITPVSVKEMFQNSFDAIKGALEKGKLQEGNISINMDPRTRTLVVHDDGLGMPASVLGKEFLEIAGTKKETKRSSGGFGVAKMLFLYNNEQLKVTTMRDGKVATLVTTGPDLKKALVDKKTAPFISVRPATEKDLAVFPKGHGTRVEAVIPQFYKDSTTGEQKEIRFDTWAMDHKVLQNSPLFDNVNVTFNGESLPVGMNFPLEDFTQFTNVKTDWGTARIYISRAPNGRLHSPNAHVLSNGLWQFSANVKKDPQKTWGENIPFTIYIDINPRVEAGSQGYPFQLNRQGFSETAKPLFGNIFTHISTLFQEAAYAESVKNFGSMQFLSYDPERKIVIGSETKKIEPKAVKGPGNALASALDWAGGASVVDGKLIVAGREIPELGPDELKSFVKDDGSLRISQDEIDHTQVILHDNTEIVVSSMETRSVTDYGRERFGRRFDEFTFGIGNLFLQLRDAIVRISKKPVPTDPLEQIPFEENLPRDYADMAKVGVGVSFDQEYRGVSIKIPFEGMFINPVVPQSTNPIEAGVDITITMIHEVAHHYHRNHAVPWRAEFQRLLRVLETTEGFNLQEFKQRIINVIGAYDDIFQHMNEVFTSGNFTIRNRGKRFEDDSSDEARDGQGVDHSAGPGRLEPRGSKLSDWVAASETTPATVSGRAEPAFETRRSRSSGPADNGRARNYASLKHVDPGISAPPQQPETSSIRAGVNHIVPAGPQRTGPAEAAAHADRFNWFYKWMTGLTELLDANPYFTPLRNYVERVRMMHNDETKVHDAALRIMKDWRSLGEQNKNLEAFIIDIQDMPYLTSGERAMNLWRHPTQQEFNALVAKHKLSNEALAIYNRLRTMDDTFLRLVEQNAIEDAQRRYANDPTKLITKLDEIRATGQLARAQPFFPFTRFGRYYLAVKDATGKTVSFETFEPKRFVGVTVKRAEKYQMARKRALESKIPPGHTVEAGVLPETAEPLIGMPTLLLQSLQANQFGLTNEQIIALQNLQLARNPAMALRHRATYGDPKIPGYSRDLQRSFARYYFHGGRYYAKAKHGWALKGHVGEAQLAPGNKAGLIASYMADHLQNVVLDARGDFGYFKGAIFLWAMGYVPAAATQNLTQTPMITLPFLAGKFGDGRASAALVRAMTQMSNFYKRGEYDKMTGFEFQALSYGIKTGRISETQAPELAGIASGGNLYNGQGGTKLERGATLFIEKAASMFEMAEQFNRRVAFRAALKLAVDNPNAKFVQESIQKYQNEYQSLVSGAAINPQGNAITQAEAAAIITAIHAVDQTQYVYARYARPRFMRGPLASTLFVFKRYMQSTLVMLGHNKSDVLWRYLVVAMLMGGLGGLPGWDDMTGIFNAFAKWYFGKDVNVQRMVREYVLQWFDGSVPPDMVLQGLARRGFGIPALVDMLGSKPGRGFSDQPAQNVPFPVLDRSRALSMGNILPVEIGKLLEPTDKQDKMIADQTQKASGAVFSVGFNIYKALFDKHMEWGDPKRWERAVPRAVGSLSRSYRAFTEGRERAKGGPDSAPTIIRYDTRDTEQMMEAFALAGGYQPLRLQAKWDSILAKAEVIAFYDLKKKGLLEQYFEARKGQNKEEIEDVRKAIIEFNKGLPEYARSKTLTGDTIQRSMAARERSLQARESGTPVQRSNVPISRQIDRLFPEATVDVRRVR